MGKRYASILDTIGRTPVVRLSALAPEHVKLYVKLEAFNPMGSVKDRLALGIVEDAEARGLLRPGQTVIEATSGNTGIGLAMVCARKGYPLVVVMAENFSVERRRLMRFLGARVVLTPASAKGSGMLAKAEELAAAHGWFLCRQFENEANAAMHSRTTAREILDDFEDEPLDWWVTGTGTGGTLKGVASVLRRHSPRTRIAVCEPDNSPMLASGIRQPRTGDGAISASHPGFRPHVMQGWSPDFVPALTERALEESLVDRIVPVDGGEAMRLSRELARREGIFTGISAGATLAGALAIAREAAPGTSILCMLPDTGERYLSTPLFADVPTEMTDEEREISRSTPNFRFDPLPPPAAATVTTAGGAPAAGGTPPGEDAAADAGACAGTGAGPAAGEPAARPARSRRFPAIPAADMALLGELIGDRERPVVMFALAWCEFCWSLRKLFDRLRIPYRPVDLDSVEYQRDDLGGRLRAALAARTGMATIPQVFVGGTFIGGCTETLEAWRDGTLPRLLRDLGVDYDVEAAIEPHSFLPGWIHPRRGAP